MKALLATGLAMLLAAPPPPPPDDGELPDVNVNDGDATDTSADDDPSEPNDQPANDGPTTVDAAALEPATRDRSAEEAAAAESQSVQTQTGQGSSSTTTTTRTEPGELELDPYGRDTRPRTKNPGRGLMISGIVVNAVAVGVGVGALVYVVRGSQARNAIKDAGNNGAQREGAIEDLETADRNAIILGATAGGLVVVGSILYFSGRKKKRDAYATTLAPSVSPQHAGLVFQGRF